MKKRLENKMLHRGYSLQRKAFINARSLELFQFEKVYLKFKLYKLKFLFEKSYHTKDKKAISILVNFLYGVYWLFVCDFFVGM